jgi:hypothetical protein
MAYDGSRGVTVIYSGGGGNGDLLSDTWEWDGTNWTQRQVQAPEARAAAVMAYDSDRHVCILFGGVNSDGLFNDLWTWDGQVWTKLDTPGAPPKRVDPMMTYDSVRHAIVLFGGEDENGKILGDTWEYICSAPCYPDLDGNGTLDLFDFLSFVNLFNAAAPDADCDGNGALDLFDFLCFINAFNKGC